MKKRHSIPELGWKAKYCYRCSSWLTNPEEHIAHVRAHLSGVDLFCGLIRMRGVLIVPFRCPFCLGDDHFAKFTLHERLKEFDKASELLSHLEQHLCCLDGRTSRCPHPKCTTQDQFSKCDLLHHLSDYHGFSAALRSCHKRCGNPNCGRQNEGEENKDSEEVSDDSNGGVVSCSPSVQTVQGDFERESAQTSSVTHPTRNGLSEEALLKLNAQRERRMQRKEMLDKKRRLASRRG